MSGLSLPSVVRSEWIKFRSVRSTLTGLLVTVGLTIGLGALIATAIRGHWDQMDPIAKLTFDPVSTSLGGTLFAQFATGVIGTQFITSEYSSGSIRTTLAAVPRRGLLVAAKLVVLVLTLLVVAELVCVGAFLLGQSIFAGVVPTASLATGGVLRAVLLGGLYLTLLGVWGFALGLILRHSAAAISTFTSLLMVLPIVMLLLPASWQSAASKYLPSELGRAMMSSAPRLDLFSPGVAVTLLVVYVALTTAIGTTLLVRRDA